MSHSSRRHLIIAPDSPPATPPNSAVHSHPRHTHFNTPGPPRVIVQRSKFSLQNPKGPRFVRRTNSPSPSPTSNTCNPAVFKLDEELVANQPPQMLRMRGRGSSGSGGGGGAGEREKSAARVHGLRRSESLDGLEEDVEWLYGSGRISESEPSTGTHRAAARPVHRYKQISDIQTLRSMKTGRASAPIQIPSRKVQMEEKRRTKLAAERAKMVTGGNLGSEMFGRKISEGTQRYDSIRTTGEVRTEGYSSSDDSMDEIASRQRR